MKLQLLDGMLVKRKDNGAKGVIKRLNGNMWNVKYHDGTNTYTTEDKLKDIFVVSQLNMGFPPETKEAVVEPKTDLIDQQEHYTNKGIQPIEIMKANMTKEKYRGFLEGNIIKYPLRYEDKNGLEDLKKAKTYLTWLIEDIEERGL